MAIPTARSRNKAMMEIVTAIIDDDTASAEKLFHEFFVDRIKHGAIESEEGLSKWYQDGVEELEPEEKVAEFVGPPKKKWWHGIGFH